MAERQLPKLNVAGSIPVSRSNRVREIYKSSLSASSIHMTSGFFSSSFTIGSWLLPDDWAIDVLAEIGLMAALVGHQLSINPEVAHQS